MPSRDVSHRENQFTHVLSDRLSDENVVAVRDTVHEIVSSEWPRFRRPQQIYDRPLYCVDSTGLVAAVQCTTQHGV